MKPTLKNAGLADRKQSLGCSAADSGLLKRWGTPIMCTWVAVAPRIWRHARGRSGVASLLPQDHKSSISCVTREDDVAGEASDSLSPMVDTPFTENQHQISHGATVAFPVLISDLKTAVPAKMQVDVPPAHPSWWDAGVSNTLDSHILNSLKHRQVWAAKQVPGSGSVFLFLELVDKNVTCSSRILIINIKIDVFRSRDLTYECLKVSLTPIPPTPDTKVEGCRFRSLPFPPTPPQSRSSQVSLIPVRSIPASKRGRTGWPEGPVAGIILYPSTARATRRGGLRSSFVTLERTFPVSAGSHSDVMRHHCNTETKVFSHVVVGEVGSPVLAGVNVRSPI
uniref:Uncharacterized protein n=1 Tax=Timema monikensis TaxID=170555 RepID=A0A7R9HJ82_9NEOP|nr:unnamed protein product [Timema monikensis]